MDANWSAHEIATVIDGLRQAKESPLAENPFVSSIIGAIPHSDEALLAAWKLSGKATKPGTQPTPVDRNRPDQFPTMLTQQRHTATRPTPIAGDAGTPPSGRDARMVPGREQSDTSTEHDQDHAGEENMLRFLSLVAAVFEPFWPIWGVQY